MKLQKKRSTKILKYTRNTEPTDKTCLLILDLEKKNIYRQNIPKPRKETIDILVTSKNGGRKIM